MDVVKAAKFVQDEAECPICLHFLKEPVILECGHNFCKACITLCWAGAQSQVSCPQCRQSFATAQLRPNKKLGNILELIKQFRLRDVELVKAGSLCELHDQPVVLFCKTDQVHMCSECFDTKIHRDHLVAPLEEAALEYKNEIQAFIEVRKKKRRKILQCFSELGGQKQTLMQLMHDGSKKMAEECKQLWHLAREVQDNMMDLAGQMKTDLDVQLAKLCEEASHAEKLIAEMGKKCGQPACEFLQDIKQTMSRFKAESHKAPESFTTEVKQKLWDLSLRSLLLQETLRKCTETLLLKPEMERAYVTLDPATASLQLSISEDGKTVKHGPRSVHPVPSSQGFVPCVFSCEGFTLGRSFWEVTAEGGSWAVGIAKESVKKKDGLCIQENEGIWVLQSEKFQQLWCKADNKIRVCLDYEGGWVAFFDADTCKLIVTLPAVFAGEKVFAYFILLKLGTQIKLCS